MSDYQCPRCGQMNIKFKGTMPHSPYGGVIKVFTCDMCNQLFMVKDDGKTRNTAFNAES
jgi:C4-type Zn-finger protein